MKEPALTLTFLGTSAGLPTLQRNVTALVLQVAGSKFFALFDCGEGAQQQLLRAHLSLCHISHIFITHLHGDHIYGLPGLMNSRSMQNCHHPLTLIGPKGLAAYIKDVLNHSYSKIDYPYHIVELPIDAWPESGPGKALRLASPMEIELTGSPSGVLGQNIRVSAYRLNHSVPCFGYKLVAGGRPAGLNVLAAKDAQIPEGPLWGALKRGQRIQTDDGRIFDGQDFLLEPETPFEFIICGDNLSPEVLSEAIVGGHLLVHEATYTEEVFTKLAEHPKHSTAAKVARFAESVGLPNLILTHFSARYGKYPKKQTGQRSPQNISMLAREAQQHFSGTLFLANDFDRFGIDVKEKSVHLLK